MNRIAAAIALPVLLLACAQARAVDDGRPRVLLIPYTDTTWDHKDSEGELTALAASAIRKSGSCSYVSPERFAANWMKVLTEKERRLFTSDPAAQMKDLKSYRPMFKHSDLGTLANYRDRWGVDFVVIGDIRPDANSPELGPVLYTEIVSMGTGRFYGTSDGFRASDAKELVGKQVARLVAKIPEAAKVDSDGVIIPARSVVGYDIRAVNGEYLRIAIDYSSDRPNPDMQKVEIFPLKGRSDGILPLQVKTRELRLIKFQFFYHKGEFVNNKIYVEGPRASGDAMGGEKEYEEKLSVVSAGGHVIRLTVLWKDNEISGVRAEPAVNPYGEVR